MRLLAARAPNHFWHSNLIINNRFSYYYFMPRKRPPNRPDQIADAATRTFIEQGYAAARISQIAQHARVGPGTVYLYAEGKEALYDLALRRAFEDPTVWSLALPHPAPAPGAVAEALWRCLQNAAHFPQLWLAAESPPPDDVAAEVGGVLRELYTWMERYRLGIKLVERSARDWPDVAQVFYRRFWRGGVRRFADYLTRRMQEGRIPQRPDGLVAAHLVIESLAWMAIHREWTTDGVELSGPAAEETVLGLLAAAVCGRVP